MAELYLGVDGGASSTTALIADESGRILGRGTGGPCNHVKGAAAREKFRAAMGDCLQQAAAQAQILTGETVFAAACLGFSGGPHDKEEYSREMIESREWTITHDADIGLAGALAGEPGIMVIAGTGSMAFGRNRHGKTARAGGWGYIFGDEGGALSLVRQGLRAALQQEEGWGEHTQLTTLFLEATGKSTINEILHDFYVMPRSEVAAYARLVNEAAEAGDTTALSIFEEAGNQLAWYVDGVRRSIFSENDALSVSYVGGAFRSPFLLRSYRHRIRERLGTEIAAPAMSPASGALVEAFKLRGKFSSKLKAVLQNSATEIK